jgi:SAM-dependent methyltransferase
LSLIASFSEGEEMKLCVRCRANLRYEMLATVIRSLGRSLEEMTVLELDSRSPLQPLLSKAKVYYRSYYSSSEEVGSIRPDGVRCEDITRLTFPSSSVDLIVSSDVLEHVPDIGAAFKETHRVLSSGGCHIFTVPPRSATRKRAEIIDGEVKFLTEADYHSDPLNPAGILAFWDFGTDAGELFAAPGLDVSIVAGPEGKDQRIVWKAVKR